MATAKTHAWNAPNVQAPTFGFLLRWFISHVQFLWFPFHLLFAFLLRDSYIYLFSRFNVSGFQEAPLLSTACYSLFYLCGAVSDDFRRGLYYIPLIKSYKSPFTGSMRIRHFIHRIILHPSILLYIWWTWLDFLFVFIGLSCCCSSCLVYIFCTYIEEWMLKMKIWIQFFRIENHQCTSVTKYDLFNISVFFSAICVQWSKWCSDLGNASGMRWKQQNSIVVAKLILTVSMMW